MKIPPDKGRAPEPVQPKEQKKIAQIPSEGGLLSKALSSFLTVLIRIPPFLWIHSYFVKRGEKQNLIEHLLSQINQDESVKKEILKPVLDSFSNRDLDALSSSGNDLNGLIRETASAPANRTALLKKKIGSVIAIANILDRANRLLGNRMTQTQKEELKKYCENNGNAKKVEIFFSSLEKVRRLWPEKTLTSRSKEAEKIILSQAELQSDFVNFKSLKDLCLDLIDVTILANSQIIEEPIGWLFGEKTDRRYLPLLKGRLSGENALLQQFQIFAPTEKRPQGKLEISITDPKTLETATLDMEFPLEEKESLEKRLIKLSLLAEIEGDVVTTAKEKGFTEKEAAQYLKTWQKFHQEAEEKLLQTLALCNSRLIKKPVFEYPERSALLKNPTRENARLLAKKKSLFRLASGHLSLLPPETPDTFKEMGILPPGILEKAKSALINKETQAIAFDSSFLSFFVTRNEDLIELRMELNGSERKVYFVLEDESYENWVERIAKEGLLERELLLLKAEAL